MYLKNLMIIQVLDNGFVRIEIVLKSIRMVLHLVAGNKSRIQLLKKNVFEWKLHNTHENTPQDNWYKDLTSDARSFGDDRVLQRFAKINLMGAGVPRNEEIITMN